MDNEPEHKNRAQIAVIRQLQLVVYIWLFRSAFFLRAGYIFLLWRWISLLLALCCLWKYFWTTNNWILVLQSKSSQGTLKSIAVSFILKSFLIGVVDTNKLVWIFNILAILSQLSKLTAGCRVLAAPKPDMRESWMGKHLTPRATWWGPGPSFQVPLPIPPPWQGSWTGNGLLRPEISGWSDTHAASTPPILSPLPQAKAPSLKEIGLDVNWPDDLCAMSLWSFPDQCRYCLLLPFTV